MKISKTELDLVKKEVLSDLAGLVKKIDLKQLSFFNKGYLGYQKNPYVSFIATELYIWNRVIDFYAWQRDRNCCRGIVDIGTFIPFYPVVLKKIGYEVEVVENISLYGKSFEPIAEYIQTQGIKLHNLDIIKEPLTSSLTGFDFLLIALVEHLNGSPRLVLDKIRDLMEANSLLFILAPNICRLANCFRLLSGQSILPLYQDYFLSAYPFEGHNREMTLGELLLLCDFSGLQAMKKGCLIRSAHVPAKIRLFNIIKRLIPGYADAVYVIARKTEAMRN